MAGIYGNHDDHVADTYREDITLIVSLMKKALARHHDTPTCADSEGADGSRESATSNGLVRSRLARVTAGSARS